jgi:PEP-CTERM motif
MALGVQPLWADITIDLGPSRIATNEINRVAFSDLNGTPVGGTLSVNFIFSNNSFVRLFNQYSVPSGLGPPITIGTSYSLDVGLSLQTSGSGLVGFLQGTGYVFDRAGNHIPGFGVTGASSSDQGDMSIGLFPLFRDKNGTPNLDLARPLDFYGVHFDLILPNAPSLKVTGADFAVYDSGGEFGIGPNVPFDIPEPSMFAFAALGALAVLFRRRG